MVKYNSHRFGHRLMLYAAIVAVVQMLLGLMLLASVGRGPIGALYIVIMVNFAILIDNPFAIKPGLIVGSWEWNLYFLSEVLMGSFFMFLIVLALGETIRQFKKKF
mgnify:CR=1 FL=1